MEHSDYNELARVIGEEDAEAVDVAIETIIHSMIIGDWRRVGKGRDQLLAVIDKRLAAP